MSEAGPPRPSSSLKPLDANRQSSKIVSSTRPPISSFSRRLSSPPEAGPSVFPIQNLQVSTGDIEPIKDVRAGLKRRTSTPSLLRRQTAKDAESLEAGEGQRTSNAKVIDSRARSTSTSLVVPDTLSPSFTYLANSLAPDSAPPRLASSHAQTAPVPSWASIYVTPASPEQEEHYGNKLSEANTSLLDSAYNFGESSVLRLARWVQPRQLQPYSTARRGSDVSEKGFDLSEDSSLDSSQGRASEENLRRGGKYWGLWGSREALDDETGYFSQSSTPPDDRPQRDMSDFAAALQTNMGMATLPTPTLSTQSLSRPLSRRDRLRGYVGEVRDGGLRAVLTAWTECKNGKTGEAVRDLGWTFGLLAGTFVASAVMAWWMIQSMPM